MRLFSTDFARSFLVGFAVGAVVVFTSLDGDSANPVVTQAVAATQR